MITIYNSNLDFDLDSSNSITLSSTSNMVFKTNGIDKMSIVNNGISVSGNVVVSGLITSTGAGFSGIGANLTNIPISAINELRLELNGGTTELSVTRDTLNATIVSEARFGSNYTNRINSELNTRVDNTSNYVLATSNILIGRIINTSNYVDSTSNFLSGRIDNTSNYVFATSNILIGRIINTSNYVDSTSNFLSGRLDNTSNYVFATSNILIGRIINTSNYVDSTSNFLGGRIDNTSNYALATSNILIGRVINASNYVESTSNILIGRVINTSNYVESTSNILIGRLINASNYTESTSNILIGRIINASNYVDSTSNFLGGRIDNTSNYVFATSNILIGRLINTSNYVDSTSNFLGGRIDNTSNYVFATSNILVGRLINTSNYVDSTSNFLGGRIDNTSNYVFATSNILIGRVINASNYVESTSNTLIGRVINSSNYVESTSNTLIGRVINASNYTESTSNILIERSISTSNFLAGRIDNTSNYVFATSNILIGRLINTSNYVDSTSNFLAGRIDNTSNYVNSTSNILIGRVVHTSNYVSSYKPATAVRADTADKFTISRRIANVPFDGSADINISYNSLDNKLNATTGINIDVNNNISATYASTDLMGIFNTTDFVDNAETSKIELSNNTSNYVRATSNILIGRIRNTSNYIDSINTSLTSAIVSGGQWTSSNANIYYNKGNVGVGTFNPSNNLHIYSSNNTGANANLAIQEWNSSNYVSSYVNDIITTPVVSSSIITGTMYKYAMFTYTSDTQGLTGQTQYLVSIPENFVCDILMIGGGGKGGYGGGGGGGAGACIVAINQTLSAGNYYFRVGKGGTGYTSTSVADTGYNTDIRDITNTLVYSAIGGGGGGAFRASSANTNTGSNGGCGGGAGACASSGSFNALLGGLPVNNNVVNRISAAPGINADLNYAVLGNQGGGDLRTTGSASDARDGAGGGGIGLKGSDHTNTSTDGASGGIGAYQVSINTNQYNFRRDFVNNASFGVQDGTSGNYYIGGGGGGGDTGVGNVGQGGLGGGGIGGNDTAGGNALDNTGGGGGGSGGAGGTAAGGNGGSGLIVLKYKRLYEGKPEIQLIIGNSISSGFNNYKIGNYNGEFQVKSSISSIDTTAITIRNSGNVGIGTTDTSTFKLNVGGSINVSSLFVNGSAFTGNNQWIGTTNIYNNSGNVGIGTNNPSNILQVGGGGRLRIANGVNDYTLIGTSDVDAVTNTNITICGNTYSGTPGQIYYIATSTGSHIFSTTDTRQERMRIASNGNVGIGTTDTATYKLFVNGSVRTGNVGIGTTNVSSYNLNVAGTAYVSSSLEASGNTRFYSNSVIDGNVAIGTTDTSSYKLYVNGSSRSSSLYNTGTIVSDGNITTYGKVGIGIASSIAGRLHIYDTTSSTTSLIIQNNLDQFNNITSSPSAPIRGTSANYTYMMFTYTSDNTGSGQTQYTLNIPAGDAVCDVLIVGGGGGGNIVIGGGGGGGAVLYATGVTIPAGSYTIKVGRGGTRNVNGSQSEAFGAICLGGGSQPNTSWPTPTAGRAGGSGSGGSSGDANGAYSRGGVGASTKGTILSSGTLYNGCNGGNGCQLASSTRTGGGGGGGGAVAEGGSSVQTNYSTREEWINAGCPSGGGNGVFINITGTGYYWGAGGGGGVHVSPVGADGGLGGGGGGGTQGTAGGLGGTGGISAGGNGGTSSSLDGGNGGAHTGSGGGGSTFTGSVGSSGGSGVIIIRVLEKNSTIQLIRGTFGDGNIDYNIGNYGGEFKIISSVNNLNTNYIRITSEGYIFNATSSPYWSTTSDKRIKENIEKASYNKCYDNINNLELYRFNYINGFNNVNKDINQLGFIAQEVQDVFPKAVTSHNFNNKDISIPDLLSIDINQINLSLYGAVKKLIEMNDDKEKRIKFLIEMNDDKDMRIKKIECLLNTSNSFIQ